MATEAKKTAGRPKKAETPEVDFSGLTFEPAEMPKPPNPFRIPLGESYEYEKAVATRVPAVGLSRAEALLRRAADDLNIGVSIAAGEPAEMPDADGKPVTGPDGKPLMFVELIFQGKPRRKRKSKDEAESAPAEGETPSAEDASNREPANPSPSPEGSQETREPASTPAA